MLIFSISVNIFNTDLVDEGLTSWQSFNKKHLSDAKKFIFNFITSLNLALHTLGQVLSGDSLKVTNVVVKRYSKRSEDKFHSHGVFLFDLDSLVRLDDLVDIHQSIRVEHLVVTLPEDFRKIAEEIMQIVLNLGSLCVTSVNKLVNTLASSESITPLFSLESVFKLVLSNLQKRQETSIFSIKCNWMRDV